MNKQELISQVSTRFALLTQTLDERGRRAVGAAEALALGWGGIALVSSATGLARDTIALGIKELRGLVPPAPVARIRRAGGGRPKLGTADPSLLADLERLVEPTTRGDPQSPLRWTCLSV